MEVVNTHMPDQQTVLSAIELANRAPSVHNTQPWHWLIGTTSIHLMADLTRRVPVTDADGRDLLLSCGAALDHLRVAFAACGWRAAFHHLPNAGQPEHLAAVELVARTPSEQDIALAAAIPKRRTDRRRFTSWPVPHRHLDLMVDRAAEAGALLIPVVGQLTRLRLTTAIDQAALRQREDPEYQAEIAGWSGRGRLTEDGVMAGSAQPAGRVHGDTTMRTFSGGTLPDARTARDEPDGGQLLVVATLADNPTAILRAGEAASIALLTATGLGMATCPLSQPFEIADTRAMIRDEVLDGAAHPHLIVRTGWLPVSTPPPPRSPRRQLMDTVDHLPAAWPPRPR